MIYDEILRASVSYRPQFRTVIKKFNFTQQAPYRCKLEKLYGGAEAVLKSLSSKYGLGIIANQSDGLEARLNGWGIAKYFTHVISSWDYHVMKPDVRLFEAAVKKTGFKPEETAMVGDRLDNDIFPAKSLGIKTVWIKQGFGARQKPISEMYIPDAEINSPEEILNLF